MMVFAWVTLVFFGFYTLVGLKSFFNTGLTPAYTLVWFFSILMSALACGILWGGLLQ